MINSAYDQQIRVWLEKHRDCIVEQLLTLMRIPSFRGDAEPGAPYGADCQKMLEATENLFRSLGFGTRTEAGRGYTLAFSGTGEKTIGIFAHGDVVPPGDGWQLCQPFEPVIRDGAIVGRGCSDDKAAVLAAACAMTMIRDLSLPVRSRLLAFTGVNEETGMADVQAFKASEQLPDVCLVADGLFPCSMGEKTKIAMWAQYDTPLQAIRDFRGGVSTSVVLGEADISFAPNAALEAELRGKITDNSTYSLRTQEDGSLLLHVAGISSHAAWPEKSVNAAALAGKLLRTCQTLPDSDRSAMATLHDYLSDVSGHALGIACSDPLFGPLTTANSMIETVDGKLRLNMDARCAPEQNAEALQQKLLHAWDSRGWSLPTLTVRQGFRVDESSPIPEMIRKLCQELTGLDRPLFCLAGGTYSRYLPNSFSCGTFSTWAGYEPALQLPEGYGGFHQPDECLDIESFLTAIRIITHMVLQCDELLHA